MRAESPALGWMRSWRPWSIGCQPPRWTDHPRARALIFDSQYDPYQGRDLLPLRVFSGTLSLKMLGILLMSDQRKTQVKELGTFMSQRPSPKPTSELKGEVGYVVTGIRDVADIKIGDTLTLAEAPAEEMLPGYKEVRPMVF